MATRRIIYALAWVGCFIFFLAYQEWLSWLILITVTSVPLFSLLISLPAMLTARLEIPLPAAVTKGTALVLQPQCVCKLPVFFRKCTVIVTQPMTGLRQKIKSGRTLPTDHCGELCCTVTRASICDYLGLFRIPLRRQKPQTVLVRPISVPMSDFPPLERYLAGAWRPKAGGGFAENHELRLYRPGDSIHQIHWKLSAKTGKLILREPMELRRKPIVVGLVLQGDPDQLDRMLGRLFWFGSEMLQKNVSFEVQYLSAAGLESRMVTTERDLQEAIDAILAREPLTNGSAAGHWHYCIGGGTNET